MPRAPLSPLLSQLAFALGSIWAAAGGGRVLFGERITLPVLPPLDLHEVHAGGALAVALGCFVVAAVLGRAGVRQAAPVGDEGNRVDGPPGVPTVHAAGQEMAAGPGVRPATPAPPANRTVSEPA